MLKIGIGTRIKIKDMREKEEFETFSDSFYNNKSKNPKRPANVMWKMRSIM